MIISQYFSLGSLHIRYYSLTMVLAIVVGYIIASRRRRQFGISKEIFEDMVFWLIIISFISARIYYVLFYWQYFKSDWLEIFKIWHGGISIYGGVIGGMAVLWYFARKIKFPFLKLADFIALSLPLAQAIGRFGNFFNYEAFGAPTNLPWKMYVPWQFRPQAYKQYSYFHPTFLYEAFWDVLVFIVLWLFAKRVENIGIAVDQAHNAENTSFKRTGLVTAAYLLLYSTGRFFIEGLRLDSAYFGNFKGDQITAVLLILVSLGIIVSRYAAQNSK